MSPGLGDELNQAVIKNGGEAIDEDAAGYSGQRIDSDPDPDPDPDSRISVAASV